MNKRNVVTAIGHTTLKPEAIRADVARIVEEGAAADTFSVCVSPSILPLNVSEGLQAACMIGFPSGAVRPEVKALEAAPAAADGADEIDTVINIELVKDGRLANLEGEVAVVRQVVPSSRVLKIIIEAAALADDEIVTTCRASMAASVDFVKTSTGFYPAGGVSTHAVALIRATVGEALGIKAPGGIRDAETVLVMIEAGASRLGVSAANAILAGLEDRDDGVARARPPVGEPRPGPRDGPGSGLRY